MLTRVAARRSPEKGLAVLIEIDRVGFGISHADKGRFNSEKKIKAELLKQAASLRKELPKIFIHINRDGSIAIATGKKPKTWPEDEQ